MYTKNVMKKTTISYNETVEGETIENKVRRILENKEPIKDGAPLIYTERKNGVMPEYNVKTDRFEVAVIAMDAVAKSHLAKREARHNPPKTDGGAEPIQASRTTCKQYACILYYQVIKTRF